MVRTPPTREGSAQPVGQATQEGVPTSRRLPEAEEDEFRDLQQLASSGAVPTPPHVAGGFPQAGTPGTRRAAVFILSLEEQVATRLLRCLNDEELSRIAAEIADLGVIDEAAIQEVLHEFHELEQVQTLAQEGGLDQAIRMVEKAFPAERAQRVVQLLQCNRKNLPLAFLATVESETLLACLEDEHPQTLAVILAHMVPSQAAEVLERFDPERRREVLPRVASLEVTSADALRRVETALRQQLESVRVESAGDAGGVKAVAEIVRAADDKRLALLDDLRQGKPELAAEIHRHLFAFDDIVLLDDDILRLVLEKLPTKCLAFALKGASSEVQEKVLRCPSRRRAEGVRRGLAAVKDQQLAHVEAARREVVETVLEMVGGGGWTGSPALPVNRVDG